LPFEAYSLRPSTQLPAACLLAIQHHVSRTVVEPVCQSMTASLCPKDSFCIPNNLRSGSCPEKLLRLLPCQSFPMKWL
jgi:hypothetical protein